MMSVRCMVIKLRVGKTQLTIGRQVTSNGLSSALKPRRVKCFDQFAVPPARRKPNRSAWDRKSIGCLSPWRQGVCRCDLLE
ncbi:hypothetical protein BaRGS_00002496 [Batillaria attramentaria]|uniref:Uncharacterized protein n=1 Tax=Batillaria attramentaria TaxID=370345 RepID=A0ABD0M3J5_9CAEN